MSSPTSTPSNGADRLSSAAPYAFPNTGSAPVDRTFPSARGKVAPYVPAPWRGTPAVRSVLPVTPRSVTPRSVTPRSVTPFAVGAVLAPELPPAYPTPVYFTPLGSQAQDEGVAPDDQPGIVEEAGGRTRRSSELPLASLDPAALRLPWIDAFLSSTPAMPMRAVDALVDALVAAPVEEPVEEPVASRTPPSSEVLVDEAVAATAWPTITVALEVSTPSDAWALDEAAEQMRALADQLREHEGIMGASEEGARLFDETSSVEQLSEWGDDDMIDIMPRQTERHGAPNRMPAPGVSPAVEPWADRARRTGDENTESAARALEVLARRVRDGEISLAGYEPRLGEAAAIAAALAALLGVRR